MAGPFDFLHIKRRTAGSSNELSFDVLDAARDDIDSQRKRSSRVTSGPKPSQGTYHGVAGTSTLSAVPEVERRKKARRAHTRRLWIIAALAIVALVGTASFFGYRYVQDRMDFNGRFNLLIERFVDIDSNIVELDDLIKNPLSIVGSGTVSRESSSQSSSASATTNGLSDRARKLQDLFPSMKRELNAITVEVDSMRQMAQSDEDKTILSHVRTAASARTEMIESAEKVFDVAKHAAVRIGDTTAAWDKVMKADTLARDAAELANKANSEEATVESRRLTESARSLLQEAREDLQIVQAGDPPIDFTPEMKYIEKRLDSLEAAIKTSNALLSNNREGAISANNDYNAADKEAASLAAKLPASEREKVAQLYASQLEKEGKTYDDKRATATTADSAIRSYISNR